MPRFSALLACLLPVSVLNAQTPAQETAAPLPDPSSQQEKPAVADKPAKPAAPAIPSFEDGDDKGCHAVYRKPKFVACVLANGSLTIQCMEKGKPQGAPISVFPSYSYHDAKNKWHARTVTSFDVFPQQPTTAPKKIILEGTLTDDVKFGLVYEFAFNQVFVSGWVDDPPTISFPTSYGIACRFAAVKEYPPQTPVADRKKEMNIYSVSVTPVSGKTQKFPYGDLAKGFSVNAAKHVAIQGPLFGVQNKVSVSAFSPANASLTTWLYPDFAPYQGYQLMLRKKDHASRDPNQKMVVRID